MSLQGKPERRSKLGSVDEALSYVEDGCRLGLGGVLHANRPAAFVRALIRRGVRDLRLFSAPTSGWDADLLVGAGCASETFLPMVTLARHGLAPAFRSAVEGGTLRAHCLDALSLTAGYLAAGYRHPYHLVLSLEGTDIVSDDDVFVELSDPDGNHYRAVRALPLDVAVLHVEEADEFGNLRHAGGRASDALLARAATVTIAQAERIVPHSDVLERAELTTISSQWVDMVVESPFGAHPTATSLYAPDGDHLEEYVESAQDAGAYDAYLARYVHEPEDLSAYRALLGPDRLEGLRHG